MTLMDAGFTLGNSHILCDKPRSTRNALFGRMMEKCRVPVGMSSSVIIVPGKYGGCGRKTGTRVN